MEYEVFTHGIPVIIVSFLILCVICYLFVRLYNWMMSSKSGKRRVKFSLFLDVCYLIFFSFSYNVFKFDLTPFTSTIWEQLLGTVDQVTWSNVGWWYYDVLYVLGRTNEFYMFWIVVICLSIAFDCMDLKSENKKKRRTKKTG